MNTGVRVESTGIVEDWPHGFTSTLPGDHWLVLHSMPRQEKKLIEDLRARNIPGCAFFERRARHYPGKGTQHSTVPLLGGYLFVAAPLEQRDAIYATRRVVHILPVPRPAELTADLVNLIKLVTSAQGPLIVRPEIIAGKKIAIVSGTFAGCSGIVTRRKGDLELIVNLVLLGTSIAVTLPASMAELAQE